MSGRRPFNATHLAIWLDMAALAIRLSNPKVTDYAPLKRKARVAEKASMPDGADLKPFHELSRLSKLVLPVKNDLLMRALIIDMGFAALEQLSGLDIGPQSRDGLRMEAMRGFETFRKVLAGLCNTSTSDAA